MQRPTRPPSRERDTVTDRDLSNEAENHARHVEEVHRLSVGCRRGAEFIHELRYLLLNVSLLNADSARLPSATPSNRNASTIHQAGGARSSLYCTSCLTLKLSHGTSCSKQFDEGKPARWCARSAAGGACSPATLSSSMASWRLLCETKLAEIAAVAVRFETACAHPAGTKRSSPDVSSHAHRPRHRQSAVDDDVLHPGVASSAAFTSSAKDAS